jgi:type IV secretory pathway TrbF-like protein
VALYVISGPPAAGKSTWVAARAEQGDIVVDLDRIAQALTAPGADHHGYGRTLRTVAQQARRAAISEAVKHSQVLDVYVIHTDPGPNTLRMYRQHDAELVTVDPGRDVVLARCAEQRPAPVIAAVERWYATHGDTHVESQAGSRVW